MTNLAEIALRSRLWMAAMFMHCSLGDAKRNIGFASFVTQLQAVQGKITARN